MDILNKLEGKRSVQSSLAKQRSLHQQRVDAFMLGAEQYLPQHPLNPHPKVAELRARLIFEEAMETINGLGVQVRVDGQAINRDGQAINRPANGEIRPVTFAATDPPDLIEIADGCVDIMVVTTGTLSACGISDAMLQAEVDSNNLLKFAEGHRVDEGGKLIKPPGHPNPRIAEILEAQRSRSL